MFQNSRRKELPRNFDLRSKSVRAYRQAQTISCRNGLALPQFLCFRSHINAVPFWIEMREHDLSCFGLLRKPHGVLQLKVRLHRLVARERAFHQKEINALRELPERVRVASVRSIDERCAVAAVGQ